MPRYTGYVGYAGYAGYVGYAGYAYLCQSKDGWRWVEMGGPDGGPRLIEAYSPGFCTKNAKLRT